MTNKGNACVSYGRCQGALEYGSLPLDLLLYVIYAAHSTYTIHSQTKQNQ